MKTKNWTKEIWRIALFILLLVLDLVTKFVFVDKLNKEYVLLGDLLVISPTQNFGAGFSILQKQTWLLISLTLLFLICMVVFNVKYKSKSKLYQTASAFIFAGAIGNLVDRIFFGYVRDFIYLKFINFPIFNFADMFLTFGVIMLFVYIIFSNENKKNDIKS